MTQVLGHLRFMVIVGALTLAGCAQDSPSPAGSSAQPIIERMETQRFSVDVLFFNRNLRSSALPEYSWWHVRSLSPQIITVMHASGIPWDYPGIASQACSPAVTERSIGPGNLPIVIRKDCRDAMVNLGYTLSPFALILHGPVLAPTLLAQEESFTTVFRKRDGMMLARYLSTDVSRFQLLLLDPSFGVKEARELSRQLN
ncbi:MAG: hypothetical protein INF81_01470 [Roseomonas sp.]|nr:hypothetical protein [Roseomonas sp.]MCA3428374.1 hypothetical protein [Roseomonas sp.]MCA3432670.1 hypothetical protein [Roseomonas sp.]